MGLQGETGSWKIDLISRIPLTVAELKRFCEKFYNEIFGFISPQNCFSEAESAESAESAPPSQSSSQQSQRMVDPPVGLDLLRKTFDVIGIVGAGIPT